LKQLCSSGTPCIPCCISLSSCRSRARLHTPVAASSHSCIEAKVKALYSFF
jgi:hypothetical protein